MVKRVIKKETTVEHIEETSDKTKAPKTKKPRKKYTKKTAVHKTSSEKKKKMTAREREEMLIENFVGLQHAMTNLSIKFGALSENIGGLLQVFEEAAKNFAQGGRSDDKDMLRKINSLLDQNKTIARGLVLMESKLRGKSEGSQNQTMPSPQGSLGNQPNRPRPLPSI